MAASQRKAKAPRRRAKPSWLLRCFGFPAGPSEGEKARIGGGRRRRRWWFRMCLPKVRVINISRKKVSLDAKVAALKATQSIMFEASNYKANHNHVSNTHDKVKALPKEQERLQIDNKVQKHQSNDAMCHKHGRRSNTSHTCIAPNMTKDSLIGMSIVLTTLVIMGIWGKMCAILCMSAWFYCVPLLKAATKFDVLPSGRKLRN